ncbi:MAG TPA: group I intron-associated PD-(D/E)XK endonuclease [Thermoleophilaceae bacterium]|nr:group I intron-associated PD-(D/E)XK endonuclease [Thermoleophilaceae bacterium]
MLVAGLVYLLLAALTGSAIVHHRRDSRRGPPSRFRRGSVRLAFQHTNMRSLLSTPQELSSHPVDVGQRTEAIILAELVKRGHTVLVPFGTNHRYDLVLDTGEQFVRVQCKTGRLRAGVVHFNTVSVRANTGRAFTRPYNGEADLFLVYCPDTGRVYAVDVGEAASSNGALRVAPTANGQAKGIRWAADHELPA